MTHARAFCSKWRDESAAIAVHPGCTAGAAAALGAAVLLLWLGGAGVSVLRRVCPAGAGGGDLVDLCRAVDRRIRLVADGIVGGGVARRAVGGGGLAIDRAALGPARLAAGAVHGRPG